MSRPPHLLHTILQVNTHPQMPFSIFTPRPTLDSRDGRMPLNLQLLQKNPFATITNSSRPMVPTMLQGREMEVASILRSASKPRPLLQLIRSVLLCLQVGMALAQVSVDMLTLLTKFPMKSHTQTLRVLPLHMGLTVMLEFLLM